MRHTVKGRLILRFEAISSQDENELETYQYPDPPGWKLVEPKTALDVLMSKRKNPELDPRTENERRRKYHYNG